MTQPIQVAIDGPAGAGKSSVAKVLAKRLNYIYLDTGAMYRAVTWYVLQKKISFADVAAIEQILPEIELQFSENAEGNWLLFCNGQDISQEIRTTEVSNNVSAIAMLPKVREEMVRQQQRIAANHNVIMDGRDICTAVLPQAQYKFFLTASLEERAKRRGAELEAKGEVVDYEQLRREIALRDQKDSQREVSPLRQAEDAMLIDTSNLDFSTVVEKLFSIITK